MLYLNEKDIISIGMDWKQTVEVIHKTVQSFESDNIVQPIKPYLRFKDLKNRIIAMPAYVGTYDIAGIKWIASFPDNIKCGIPRSSSVVILNDTLTGQVKSIINGSLLSVIRTASVSGLMIKQYLESRRLKRLSIGILGWGPIGQYHYQMCRQLFEDEIEHIYIYDRNSSVYSTALMNESKVEICNNWEEVYEKSNIFITCTVAKERYIDLKPRSGALLLNVSLRDYKEDIFEHVREGIVVDDWDEVCRENTDIEMLHLKRGLKEQEVLTFKQVVCEHALDKLNKEQTIMVNPMGMASFDMAIGSYYLSRAEQMEIGSKMD